MILVDAFGGDNAPDAVVDGACRAAKEYGEVITLVGDEEKIQKVMAKYSLSNDNIEIIQASEVITTEEEPALAVRRKKDASLVVGARYLKEHENSVFVSAGSTGALLASGLLVTGRIKGIARPALGVVLPGKKKPILLIDAGANAECKSEYFKQFAVMGTAYMQGIMGVEEPKVLLINIGSEEEKGSSLYKEAHQLLRETEGIHFLGNIEARELMDCDADIAVCDGFTGNVVLKLVEGMASFFKGLMKEVLFASAKTKMGALLIKKDLGEKMGGLDYKKYGGAPLLGVNGGMIKAHGSSDAEAIQNAIKQAIQFRDNGVLEKIKKNLS